MIVVDSNVIAYCWINGGSTGLAQRVRVLDPDWHVPILWRSELRNVLTGYLRRRALDIDQATEIMAAIESALSGCEHLVESVSVLELAARTRLSAYDCEFVALAESLSVALVTQDSDLLNAFPDRCLSMQAFVDAAESAPPQAHEPRARYRAIKSGRTRASFRP